MNAASQKEFHKTRLRIRVSDVDFGGVIYHGHYFALYNDARDEFMRDAGFSYKMLMGKNLHLSIVEASIKYHKPIFYDDLITIHTCVAWYRSRSIGIYQKMTKADHHTNHETLCNEAEFIAVSVFERKAVQLPAELIDTLCQAAPIKP